jgi:hypothetical protein
VLGLLAHDLDGVPRPDLDELGVLLLELQEPDALGEELLGGPRVVLLSFTNSSPPSARPMLLRWALAKFSARASKESRWASAIS